MEQILWGFWVSNNIGCGYSDWFIVQAGGMGYNTWKSGLPHDINIDNVIEYEIPPGAFLTVSYPSPTELDEPTGDAVHVRKEWGGPKLSNNEKSHNATENYQNYSVIITEEYATKLTSAKHDHWQIPTNG